MGIFFAVFGCVIVIFIVIFIVVVSFVFVSIDIITISVLAEQSVSVPEHHLAVVIAKVSYTLLTTPGGLIGAARLPVLAAGGSF